MAREKQRYGYNGNEEIDGGGLTLMDFNARIYNPSLGRFMGADALAIVSAVSSPYAFASDNPVNLVDPTGLTTAHWYEDLQKYRSRYTQCCTTWSGYQDDADKDYYGPNPLGFFNRSGRYRRTIGSGYHWGDQFKSVEWNAMTMSSSTFDSFHGVSSMNDHYENFT